MASASDRDDTPDVAEQKAAFARALASRLDADGRKTLAENLKTSVSNVSLWATNKATPDPWRVFEIERALGVEPGALSQHLGYVPVDSRPSVRSAIEADPTLTPSAKRVVESVYLMAASSGNES